MENKKIIVAIDGFSSSGKSSMAKVLARAIGYRYIDSGAMYRAVALYALEHGLVNAENIVNVPGLIASLPEIKIDFKPTANGQRTMLCGKDVEDEIRTLRVSNAVSPVAVIPEVRSALVHMQQMFGRDKGIVMDGRDIGTTVFPDAELKIYVNASAETRAMRRWKELQEKGDNTTTYEQVLDNVVTRDHIDSTRKESPLRRAEDAIDLDNSSMTIDQQNQWLMDRFNEAVNG